MQFQTIMNRENQILGLSKVGEFLRNFIGETPQNSHENHVFLDELMRKSEIENRWFTIENQKFALKQWAELLTVENLTQWLQNYERNPTPKTIGLVLAGNIPLVGFHDIISTIFSGHSAQIKLSSKDRLLTPFLLNLWQEFSDTEIPFQFVEKLADFQAVIATGSNNTARYLEHYFKDYLHIIRKNRTSLAVLTGSETYEELQRLSHDIFQYFGLGCRNVTQLLIPQDFPLEKLFKNFLDFENVIHHHQYANNYDYNRAIFLLNQEAFWDNNFVLLKEDKKLFSPLSVVNFWRYQTLDDAKVFIEENKNEIQCIVASPALKFDNSVDFGSSQCPKIDTYADNIDTMKFLEII